jgi:hypothetical protein
MDQGHKVMRIVSKDQDTKDNGSGVSRSQLKKSRRELQGGDAGKRILCECLATLHGLLSNCITCGKIVCRLEGPGPCLFCGSIVESPAQQLTLQKTRSKTSGLQTPEIVSTYRSSVSGNTSSTKQGAMTGATFPTLAPTAGSVPSSAITGVDASRPEGHVYDKEEDLSYAMSDRWRTPEERALAAEQFRLQAELAAQDASKVRLTLDLANKKVIQEDPRERQRQLQGAARQQKRLVLRTAGTISELGSIYSHHQTIFLGSRLDSLGKSKLSPPKYIQRAPSTKP